MAFSEISDGVDPQKPKHNLEIKLRMIQTGQVILHVHFNL
jgi:hypothetical protein